MKTTAIYYHPKRNLVPASRHPRCIGTHRTAVFHNRKDAERLMNNDFPRILTLLRKERGYSQKKVAGDLGISQALLSHYEKGIRECGLDFLVRTSNYYDVSCDYLLGRTPQRNGSVISVDDLPSDNGRAKKGDRSITEYNRRILTNSLNIVFGLLKKINSESLTREMTAYLSSAVYKTFRVLYSSNQKNPQGMFELDRRLFGATIESCMAMSEAKGRYILSGESIDGCIAVKKEELPHVTPEALEREFPQYAPSLFDLIKNTENAVKMERVK